MTRPDAICHATAPSSCDHARLRSCRGRRRVSASLLLCLSNIGCGGRDSPRDPPTEEAPLAAVEDEQVRPLDAIPLPQSSTQLISRLGESHAAARARIGSHALRCSVNIEVTPNVPREYPPAGGEVALPVSVRDDFELDYRRGSQSNGDTSAALDGEGIRLLQQDSRGNTREVRTDGERVFVRFHDRAWVHHLRDSALLDTWLSDSFHCVFDVVSLAGPGLVMRPQPPQAGADRRRVRYDLGLRDDSPRPMAGSPDDPSAPSSWRSGAVITRISGNISLDRATGTWDEAVIDLEFRARPREARAGGATGHIRVEATLEARATPPRWPIPEGSTPMPTRRRLTHEAQTLLDGLARP